MDEKQLKARLETIDAAYYNQDEEDAAPAIEALDELHREVWGQADEARKFRLAALRVAGGAYLPNIFWAELAAHMRNEGNREMIVEIMQAVADSNFDEAMLNNLKPLLVVYLSREKQFELDKLWSFVIEKTYPRVKEYFDKLLLFVTKNQHSVATYQRKFDMLRDSFPDFERYSHPLTRLEEELA